MKVKRNSLLEKLLNEEYVKSLSERRYKELMFCKEMLSEDELREYSSISVAYSVARSKLIEKILPLVDEELAFIAKHKHFNTIQAYEYYKDKIQSVLDEV